VRQFAELRRCRITQHLFEHSAGERTMPGIWHETYWLSGT
jgi:hypothetical protein